MPTFDYTVDGEPEQTTEHQLTPNQILRNAGFDPANHYLVEIVGATKESFQGKGDDPIHMHENMQFISVYTGPTPVS